MKYTLLFTQEPEGGYTVQVVELPGCVTFGEDLDDAQNMAREAILAYLESMQKHGEVLDLSKNTFISSLMVNETVQA